MKGVKVNEQPTIAGLAGILSGIHKEIRASSSI
jgi:hypothetical protein